MKTQKTKNLLKNHLKIKNKTRQGSFETKKFRKLNFYTFQIKLFKFHFFTKRLFTKEQNSFQNIHIHVCGIL